MADLATNGASSIATTVRDDRSFFMSVILFLLKRFRDQIISREMGHEDGSIKLSPPISKLSGCTLFERIVCDIHVYDYVLPIKPSRVPTKRIYYFAGGSWQTPPTGQHFQMCAKMAKDMPDTVVSLVSMPLAPNNPAPSSFPWCLRLYRALMAEAEASGEKVALVGDSSGGNIVLCLVLEALREDVEAGIDILKAPHPAAVMAVCPSTDMTRSNPDILKIAPRDPLLTPDVIKESAKTWVADWDPEDRRVTPMNNDISLLAKKGIKVHGITAGCDVLSPDGIVFREKCAQEGVKGEWVHWENQMHCFVLTMAYGLSEANNAVQWMIDVLKKE